ncbi:hypothetical protein GDO81_005768 [Engystomops pustulosus]|uniref:Uncharacterized protein n=1 Tax=Engystomops pustulosus TaxID=76066 RepID=A0AAV7CT40_ENGPU|nr:hypothetical protein GDO81_005768 [Engystomops pustulosus]
MNHFFQSLRRHMGVLRTVFYKTAAETQNTGCRSFIESYRNRLFVGIFSKLVFFILMHITFFSFHLF